MRVYACVCWCMRGYCRCRYYKGGTRIQCTQIHTRSEQSQAIHPCKPPYFMQWMFSLLNYKWVRCRVYWFTQTSHTHAQTHAHNERDTHTENVLVWLCVSRSAVSICAWTTFSLVFSMVRLYFHVRTLTEHSSVPRRTDVKTKFSLDTQPREGEEKKKKRFAQRRAISVIDFRFYFRCVEFYRILFFRRKYCGIKVKQEISIDLNVNVSGITSLTRVRIMCWM